MSFDLIRRYFDAFNADDAEVMLSLVTEDVEHRTNQGEVRHGRAAFCEFLAGMDTAYAEKARDLVIFEGDASGRWAAEFMIHGQYLQTQAGLPEAHGQRYTLPVGSFFDVRDGRIERVSTFYNLTDWMTQVSV